MLGDDADGLTVQRIVALALQGGEGSFGLDLQDLLSVVGRRLLSEEVANRLDFLLSDEGPVDARDLAAARHKEHVAPAEQRLCALLVENGATVELGGDAITEARRKVRLHRARDHIDRRTLGCNDHVDAGGACHLCKALQHAFDVAS